MLPQNLSFKALESTRDGLIITEYAKGKNLIHYINPAFEYLTGYTFNECIGKDCKFLQLDDVNQPENLKIRSAIEMGDSITVTLRNYKKNGELFWNELSISPIKDNHGNITHFIGIQKDVTERVELLKHIDTINRRLMDAIEDLEADRKKDYLTGLFNRKSLDYEVSRKVRMAVQNQKKLAFYFIDIDNFKTINDEYGHDVGDSCLKFVAKSLNQIFDAEGSLTIRYGGEEFLAIACVETDHAAKKMADQLLECIRSTRFAVNEKNFELNITVSIGVFCSDATNNFDIESAIEQADLAMYDAKKSGKDTSVFVTHNN